MKLVESSADITLIAYEAAYESQSAFNRAFRRMYGAPPAAGADHERLGLIPAESAAWARTRGLVHRPIGARANCYLQQSRASARY